MQKEEHTRGTWDIDTNPKGPAPDPNIAAMPQESKRRQSHLKTNIQHPSNLFRALF